TGAHRSLEALPVNAWITSVGFTPDGTSIVGRSFDGGVRVWDAASGSIVHTFTGQASGQNVVVVPSGRTALAGSEDGSVVAWDLSGKQRLGRTVRWSSPQKGCVDTPCQAIDPQSTLMATTQADGTTALIDLRRLRLLDTLPAKNGSATYPYAVAFLPDGRTLATGGINGNVTLWDVRTRSVVRTLHLPDPVRQVAISPDGELLATQTQGLADSDAKVEVRDLSSEKLLYSHRVRYGAGGVYFSPDGRALAALGCCEPDSSIVVWNARSGAELFRTGGSCSGTPATASSSDRRSRWRPASSIRSVSRRTAACSWPARVTRRRPCWTSDRVSLWGMPSPMNRRRSRSQHSSRTATCSSTTSRTVKNGQ
ncbi:MAG: hypothetical protein E6G29_13450, partial [Actinobacteria bacterium]